MSLRCIYVLGKLLTDPFVLQRSETKVMNVIEDELAAIADERNPEDSTRDNGLSLREIETSTQLLANKSDNTPSGPITARGGEHLECARIKVKQISHLDIVTMALLNKADRGRGQVLPKKGELPLLQLRIEVTEGPSIPSKGIESSLGFS